ncbi:hypothetical protein FA15DRAFT_267788 [Coprinopsis marcescibilis]|uniref:Uncharacterized protein n=1 Tax=Coprinopsis marcescibilis TaxID=230819 RepID=A0A5C3KF05_COPMA|nr:hypothetical protein FA15DRAFT_267788 [Coprinopsis marcescibilis]
MRIVAEDRPQRALPAQDVEVNPLHPRPLANAPISFTTPFYFFSIPARPQPPSYSPSPKQMRSSRETSTSTTTSSTSTLTSQSEKQPSGAGGTFMNQWSSHHLKRRRSASKLFATLACGETWMPCRNMLARQYGKLRLPQRRDKIALSLSLATLTPTHPDLLQSRWTSSQNSASIRRDSKLIRNEPPGLNSH